MKILDIKFGDLAIESDKEGNGIYSRSIYYDNTNKVFIKIWGVDYFYRKFFEATYKDTEFFNGLSAMVDVVTDDDGNLRGYVTSAGAPVNYHNLDKHKYNDLRDRLISASKQNSIIYLDLVPGNCVDIGGRYYLIDLEPVVPVSDLSKIGRLSSIWEYNDYQYRKIMDQVYHIEKDPIKVIRQGTNPHKPIVYGTANGRIYLENEYLPTLSGRTLFVGVNYYTDFYHKLTKDPEQFETLDVVEHVIEHGSPYKHYLCNILDFKSQGYLYDNVCFFGILGHDDDWDIIKDPDNAKKTVQILDSLVSPGGTLLLGPAAHKHFDVDFWDSIYDQLTCYDLIVKKRIDINYVWYGRKKA